MPKTRDRFPGAMEEDDEILFASTTDAPSAAGGMNYHSSNGHQIRDSVGTRRLRETKTTVTVTAAIAANANAGGSGGGGNLSAQLPDLSTGNFLADYDVFLNGELLEGGINDTADKHYYPGTSLALGQLKFEFDLVATGEPDRITVVKKG